MLIVAILLGVIALAGLIAAILIKFTEQRRNPETRDIEDVVVKGPNRIIRGVSLGVLALAGLFILFSSFFTQDVGQSSVLRDWAGNIVGHEPSEGLHMKAPWVDPVTFDVRNQRVVYSGKAGEQTDNTGGMADGAQITVQDRDGVSSNIDIAIRYSLKADSVVEIYSQYKNEENLKSRLIFNDIRSVVRSIPGKFTTLELLTERDKVQAAIFKALEEKWADDGVIVNDVALQEVRPPEEVRDSYAQAQQAQINVAKEQSNLEAQEVKAQQKVVNAQAEADANALLNSSLTTAILQQRYLDTLKELAASGNLVVVPEGFNGLVNVGK